MNLVLRLIDLLKRNGVPSIEVSNLENQSHVFVHPGCTTFFFSPLLMSDIKEVAPPKLKVGGEESNIFDYGCFVRPTLLQIPLIILKSYLI